MGAVNPPGAAHVVRREAQPTGLGAVPVAVVLDDGGGDGGQPMTEAGGWRVTHRFAMNRTIASGGMTA